MTAIDFDSEAGRRAQKRLQNEQVIWLTTVNSDGAPQSSPVWFLWRDGEFVIHSQPDKPKLKAIEHNPHVALNLNSTDSGENVVVFEGTARIVAGHSPGTNDREYIAKYTQLIAGWEPDDFAESFSRKILVTPTRMRAY